MGEDADDDDNQFYEAAAFGEKKEGVCSLTQKGNEVDIKAAAGTSSAKVPDAGKPSEVS